MFNTLKNSIYINNLYNQIEESEKIKGTAKHDLSHVWNVIELVEKILTQLHLENDFIESTKIAALFHDIGCVNGKKGHAKRSYQMAKDYFENNNISFPYYHQVLEAIKDHGSSFESESLMTLILILCDKLDITKERLAHEGYETYGIRQLQYIESVKVKIDNNYLHIDFKADSKIDLKELNNFDFIDKVFKAIAAFSNHQNLKAIVKINNEIWNRDR